MTDEPVSGEFRDQKREQKLSRTEENVRVDNLLGSGVLSCLQRHCHEWRVVLGRERSDHALGRAAVGSAKGEIDSAVSIAVEKNPRSLKERALGLRAGDDAVLVVNSKPSGSDWNSP